MLLADRQYLKEERMQAMLANLISKNFRGRPRRHKREKKQILSLIRPLYVDCTLNINIIISLIWIKYFIADKPFYKCFYSTLHNKIAY